MPTWPLADGSLNQPSLNRIGDALVDSGGPERFGIGSGRGIADVVRDAVARDAVVRIDDWHIDRKGQVGVELLNI